MKIQYRLYSPDDALVVRNIYIESFFVFHCEMYTKYIPRNVLSTIFHLPLSSTSIKSLVCWATSSLLRVQNNNNFDFLIFWTNPNDPLSQKNKDYVGHLSSYTFSTRMIEVGNL